MHPARIKVEVLAQLRTILADVFRLRTQGGNYANLARAQGCADGYMRALLDSGMANQSELLALVGEERHLVDGPATKELGVESVQAA